MNKNQILANELDKMEGLTAKARHMIDSTDINNLFELFGGCDADAINQMAEEIAAESEEE